MEYLSSGRRITTQKCEGHIHQQRNTYRETQCCLCCSYRQCFASQINQTPLLEWLFDTIAAKIGWSAGLGTGGIMCSLVHWGSSELQESS